MNNENEEFSLYINKDRAKGILFSAIDENFCDSQYLEEMKIVIEKEIDNNHFNLIGVKSLLRNWRDLMYIASVKQMELTKEDFKKYIHNSPKELEDDLFWNNFNYLMANGFLPKGKKENV